MSALRGALVLALFTLFTLPLMPIQALNRRWRRDWARQLPNWYHKRVCRILGIRLHIDGSVVRDRPVLLVSNHTSWLDILVLSAVAPVSFVAKKEVNTWFFISALARLQRSIFIDRERRMETGRSADEIAERLRQGDAIVLFAEGTSSDGNRVLPFRSSLFAAVKPSRQNASHPPAAVVQTVALVYTRLHGMPLGRGDRARIGWYGDMGMLDHGWTLLKAGPLDVVVRVGPPTLLAAFTDRKDLARCTEREVRAALVAILRGRPQPTAMHLSGKAKT